MLQHKGGAGISEVVQTMGWQRHTVRGFMAGAMKKAGAVPMYSSRKSSRAWTSGVNRDGPAKSAHSVIGSGVYWGRMGVKPSRASGLFAIHRPPVFRRPTFSAINFGGAPAAVIKLGTSINCMVPSNRDHLKILRIHPGGPVSGPIVTGPQTGELVAKLPLRLFSDRCKRARHRPIVRAEKLNYIRWRKRVTQFIQVARAFQSRDPAPQPFANGRLIAP